MTVQPTTIELDDTRERLLSRPATVTESELLGLVVGRGVYRKTGSGSAAHRTAVEVARAILAESGGLTGFVRTADDKLLERDGIGKVLASQLVAAAEVAARHHLDPALVGDPTLPCRTRSRHTTREDEAARRLLRDRSRVTEGELFAFLRVSWRRRETADRLLLAASGLGKFLRSVGGATLERFALDRVTGCRMIAVAEIADRYDREALRLAAGAELLRHARRIASGLAPGERASVPDLELIRELLSEVRPFAPHG